MPIEGNVQVDGDYEYERVRTVELTWMCRRCGALLGDSATRVHTNWHESVDGSG